ncbi:MAG: stage II sporulation protein M [Microscillaceae bacterium]|nr:stage II sporulation protein M [Microscillaceae bacterium]
MKETKFIEQNKEKWVNFENITRLNIKDPDKLSDLFVQITDDLSYSRTFYPNRFITLYLNHLCQQLFYNIYTNRRARWGQFLNFWREELPYIVYQSRKELLLSLMVFSLAVAIGVLSSYNDPEFVRVILGDQYVEMTLANIEGGDPMAVYKKMHEVDMFFGISFNNLRVSFFTFILGIICSIGTIAILLFNGVMVGTFQYFFIEKGLFWESFLTIWLHGTLEISSIIIAGGAGIQLGKGLIFPGTFSRLKAFQISARTGLKLILGISPIIVMAALIESFITRYTEVPDVLKGAVIFLSAFFILVYFVWYPYYKSQVGFQYSEQSHRLLPRMSVKIEFEGKIKTVNEVFADTVYFFKSMLRKYQKYALIVSVLYTGGVYFLIQSDLDNYVIGTFINRVMYHLDYSAHPEIFVLNTLSMLVIVWFVMRELASKNEAESVNFAFSMGQSVLLILILNLMFFIYGYGLWIVALGGIPILFLCLSVTYMENISVFRAIPRVYKLIAGNFGNFLGHHLLLLFLGYAFLLLLTSPYVLFSGIYKEFVEWNLPENFLTPYQLLSIFSILTFILGLLWIIPLYLIAFTMQYFSFKEVVDASGLKKQVDEFGKN